MYEELGMTDNQWKDNQRALKDELLDLKALVPESNTEFHAKIDRKLDRIEKALQD